MFNLLRLVILIVGPIVGYFILGKTPQAALVGLGLAALVVVLELIIERIALDVLIFGAIGAAGGVFIAKVLEWLVFRLDNVSYYNLMTKYSPILSIFLAYLGCMIALRKKGELDLLEKDIVVKGKKNKDVKVVDTSVLIDGRLADVADTGFLSGKLIVPRFVLHELQMVADSADATKRQRGRRGLDILKRLQENHDISVKIYDKDYPTIKEVDSKILELAKELGAKVATTDFNLNKVAALQGISVLNINDLAGSLKSVVLPGDSMTVYLAKEGKEKSQAVGYLDDGTMVVVEEGKRHIGKRMQVLVNSILQTSAGRMIFTRVHEGRDGAAEEKSHPAVDESHPSVPS